jgi:hypothetical protein
MAKSTTCCRIGYGFGAISPRHSAMPPSDRTAKIIESDESLTLSITNPLGTSDEIRIPARMALIPPLEKRKLGRKIIRYESDPKSDPSTARQVNSLARRSAPDPSPIISLRGRALFQMSTPRRLFRCTRLLLGVRSSSRCRTRRKIAQERACPV